MTTDQKITILHMAVDLAKHINEERPITEIYNELISLVKEKSND